uniref:DNA (cytosine-5-)-methyltransferase n=1 Tax=viral metagenome TaxID=1070528 RepID=A0A6M3M0A3_9ZZZZ
MNTPRVLDIFCGGGYLSYGFQMAGYDLDGGFDNWDAAVKTYEKYLGAQAHLVDVALFYPGKKDYEVIIVGGPPCDDFSLVNTRRNIYGKRAQLVLDFCRIVNDVKPEAFVFENVIHLSQWAEVALFEIPGYKVTKEIADSVDYEVPQSRKRKIFIGSKDRHIKLTPPLEAKILTVRDAFVSIETNWGFTKHRPETIEKFKNVRSPSWISKETTSDYQGTVRLVWDKPSVAITNIKKAQILHPEENRIISIAEAMALQGIPSWYIPEGPDTDKAKMIANAVPPKLAYRIAEAIKTPFQRTL